MDALQPHAVAVGEKGIELELVTQVVRKALVDYVTPVVALGQQLVQEYGLQFGGIDLSPAPLGTELNAWRSN